MKERYTSKRHLQLKLRAFLLDVEDLAEDFFEGGLMGFEEIKHKRIDTIAKMLIEVISGDMDEFEEEDKERNSKFLESANSRETSTEIIKAIWEVSGQNENEAIRIWEEPTQEEIFEIFKIVIKNGECEASDFCWGENGNHWFLEE